MLLMDVKVYQLATDHIQHIHTHQYQKLFAQHHQTPQLYLANINYNFYDKQHFLKSVNPFIPMSISLVVAGVYSQPFCMYSSQQT